MNMCDSNVSTSAICVFPLHHRWDLLEECAELLNSQWQRSMGARLHSLQQSSDTYPVCLVLLQGEMLIGHARVSRVLGSHSAFVESVVVRGDLRGRGYGRALMEGVENYARRRGFTRLYLTTHDKQHFYSHLGFVLSQPVQNVGTLASLVPMDLLHKMCRSPKNDNKTTKMRRSEDAATVSKAVPPPPQPHMPPLSISASPYPSSPLVQPPIPPPPPTLPAHSNICSLSSVAPPAPAPPSVAAIVEQTLEQTPYTDLRGLPVFWMRKDI